MKIVIAGSRGLPRGQAPRLLARFLASIPEDSAILLRRAKGGSRGIFENDAYMLARLLDLSPEWREPVPTPEHPGRVSVYIRDLKMIEEADLVLLFLTPGAARDGYSGTMHLLEKALDANRPMYTWVVDESGKVSRWGEYDPDEAFADLVPKI